MEECLDDDPAVRPTIATVCERIQVSKDAYMKECPQDVITLCKENQLLKDKQKIKNEQLTSEIEQLRNQNEQLRATIEQMVRTNCRCGTVLFS